MCILLKLDYVKFGISNLFCSKVIEEITFEGVGSQQKQLSQISKFLSSIRDQSLTN